MDDRPRKRSIWLFVAGLILCCQTACQSLNGSGSPEVEEPEPHVVIAETAESGMDISLDQLPGATSEPTEQVDKEAETAQAEDASLLDETGVDSMQVGDPSSPDETLKLIFIHHSVGENWLADDNGGLGLSLRANNYFVSDTNYGWGPDGIGDRTDIDDWPAWFQDPEILEAVLTSSENFTGNYSRLPDPDPDRVNQIIMFKSCFPNSNLEGGPDDPPSPGDPSTVGGAKYVYTQLLETFAAMPDTLFVIVTAPPLTGNESWAPPANARAFNDWLVSEWLIGYSLHNVAVFDLFNTLTSNGGDIYSNDLEQEEGNHHRWWNGESQHIQSVMNDLAAYPDGDSHPNPAGNQKATGEFIPLLNVYVRRWLEGRSRGVSHNALEDEAVGEITPKQAPDSDVVDSSQRLDPSDLAYLGAFRLPDGSTEPGWSWSGEALAYYPSGDRDGPDDMFPGSLFGTGHNHYQHVSEIAIPQPVNSQTKDLDELNTARTLQDFQNIRGDLYPHLDFELPRAALAYLPPVGGELEGNLHFAWGQHLQNELPTPTHGWSQLDLSNPQPAGAWILGDFSPYSVSDYLFPVPEKWAATHAMGGRLAAGRFRDGGWSGQGPALVIYDPPRPESAPPAGAALEAFPLIMYASTMDTETIDPSLTMTGYHHTDEWSGGAWLTAGEKQAVVFVGTKGQGDYWYGFANGLVWPDDPPYPAIPDPPNDDRGWWSTTFEGQMIFYDPNDLAAVTRGEMAPYEPQPYAALNIDPVLYNVNSAQQKGHVGAAAFDHDSGLLYVLEPLADIEKPLVHVWQVTD